jgi:hypothetical protein
MNEKLKVTRTLGFEIECFADVPSRTDSWGDTYVDYDDVSIRNCEVSTDGSLYGGSGTPLEAKTDPIKNLNIVEEVYKELSGMDMNVNKTCGLHIHVDTSDYTIEDKAKLLRFGAGIELLMFALVDKSRQGNEYTEKLHKGWRKLFRSNFMTQSIPFDSFNNFSQLERYIQNNSTHRDARHIWNGRYQWLNAVVSHCPTAEFRIFSATTDYKQAQKFGMLAYHIVETIKNSTIEQVRFIIQSIYQSQSVDEMLDRLFDSIGLDGEFRPEILNDKMAEYIDNKFCKPIRERELVGGEQRAV